MEKLNLAPETALQIVEELFQTNSPEKMIETLQELFESFLINAGGEVPPEYKNELYFTIKPIQAMLKRLADHTEKIEPMALN